MNPAFGKNAFSASSAYSRHCVKQRNLRLYTFCFFDILINIRNFIVEALNMTQLVGDHFLLVSAHRAFQRPC